jgi:exodeoxyribonuclease V beta subunit
MENKTTHLDTLTLPFSGLNVIEASAGTGKTFTLAALYVRIVIGHMPLTRTLQNGLLPSQILVMTFTEAATAELRSRIRERLAGAARFFRQLQTQTVAAELEQQADIFLLELGQAIDEEQYQLVADRLEIAAQWMDDAAIYTIHSWSSRMLKEHAFDSGALFQQSHAQDSEQMMLRATQDYWRQFFYPLDSNQSQAILGIVSDPEDLLKQLKPYWSLVNKNPGAQLAVGELPQQSSTEMSQWELNIKKQKNIIQNGLSSELKILLLNNVKQKKLKGFTVDRLISRLSEVEYWLKGFNSGITSKMLGYFAKLNEVEQLNEFHDLWKAFENSATLIDQKPDLKESLLQHAALHIHNLYEQEKKRHAQFDFNDLLKELYKALQNPDARLAKAIAKQYPIALVDEFQDTDPWQYGSLQKIYAPHLTLEGNPQEPLLPPEIDAEAHYTESQNNPAISARGLIMIGDPKQAIYSFRGADINTYLLARSHANEVYTLGYNYRSNESLVKAVNSIFNLAVKPPFGEIVFNEVQAHHKNPDNLALDWNKKPLSALTVWHLQHHNGVPNKDKLSKQLADISASHITQLLNNQTVKAGDIAVLVRDYFQASVIREALSKRAIRSVYLSEKESVFDSSEAQDLWRILRAVANPQNLSCVKAALATQLWSLNWQQLEFYIHNEKAWDAVLERFMDWQLRWKKQGVLAMIHAWLHEQNISQRLRTQSNSVEAGNERILSNVLHLAELLQNASMHLQSESALVRYLENQIQNSKASGETSLLRLESDENLVKVITMHKSKGLEYPYVYLPFVSLYKKPDSKKTEEEIQAELYENIRLLYVALTRAKTALMMTLTEVNKEFNTEGNKNPFKMNALSYLLGRQGNGDLANHLKKWNESEFISIEAPPAITTIAYKEQLDNAHNSKLALINNRTHEARWWTASFSAISKGVAVYNDSSLMHDALKVERLEDSQLENAAIQDEFVTDQAEPTQAIVNPYNSLKGGADFGTLLHDLLEWQTHQDWILAKVPEAFLGTEKDQLNADNTELEGFKLVDNYLEWLEHLEKKLVSNNIDLMHLPTINQWLYQVLKGTFEVTTAKPLQLGLLNRRQVWPEMAFTFPIKKLNAQKIDDWVSHFIHPEQSRPALHYLPLEGMMTGFMDLVLMHDNQYFILDYKSNKLRDYSKESLTEAVLHHRYEVQYTLYILALHRLLKARLKDYQYEQHVGGAIYLFLRGINQESKGLYFNKPSFELINALDLLFKNSATTEVLLPHVSLSKSGTQASLWS